MRENVICEQQISDSAITKRWHNAFLV